VPCLVLGAHAKAKHVSHVQHSHVSIVRFCEQTFGLPSLNARTAAADDMHDCFDYSKKLPSPGAAPPPPPPPPPPPANPLPAIRDAAARASARVAAAAAAAKEPAVLQELRYAAMDIERITKLSS
jgi:phospholipase C